MIRLFQRLCPHVFGWTYLPSRARRWCRVCGHEQARDELSPEVNGPWRDLYATELGGVEIERQARLFMATLEAGLGASDDDTDPPPVLPEGT